MLAPGRVPAGGLRWTDLREAELLVDMIAAEFGGEDPLKPSSRQRLVEARASLESSALYLGTGGPPLERREPGAEDMRLGREMVEKGQRLFTVVSER